MPFFQFCSSFRSAGLHKAACMPRNITTSGWMKTIHPPNVWSISQSVQFWRSSASYQLPRRAQYFRFGYSQDEAPVGTGRLTLRSSRPRAVRWPGASAPRFSATLRVALWGTKGTWRLSERTLAGPNFEMIPRCGNAVDPRRSFGVQYDPIPLSAVLARLSLSECRVRAIGPRNTYLQLSRIAGRARRMICESQNRDLLPPPSTSSFQRSERRAILSVNEDRISAFGLASVPRYPVVRVHAGGSRKAT